jgi:tRNA dimethylallyltransferase
MFAQEKRPVIPSRGPTRLRILPPCGRDGRLLIGEHPEEPASTESEMATLTPHALYLTGPTACGKTSLSLELAEALDAEIIALDSMTLYRGMDIGTAKPTIRDRQRVRHHLIDILDPWESGTLDQYLRQAEQACADVIARGKRPLFVGGTPLYLKACLRGIFEGPPADAELRHRLEEQARQLGSHLFHQRLVEVDPLAASRIQPADTRRIVRAIEVFETTGRPISHWQEQFDRPASPAPPVACLLPDRSTRHASIDQRVRGMVDAGWIEEVERLIEPGRPPLSPTASQAVGYQEIIELLAGERTREETIERIQTRTRQLSKRQMTWFRHLAEIRFFPIESTGPSPSVREEIADFFRRGPQPVASIPTPPAQ